VDFINSVGDAPEELLLHERRGPPAALVAGVSEVRYVVGVGVAAMAVDSHVIRPSWGTSSLISIRL
jgi:hypothetical protein